MLCRAATEVDGQSPSSAGRPAPVRARRFGIGDAVSLSVLPTPRAGVKKILPCGLVCGLGRRDTQNSIPTGFFVAFWRRGWDSNPR